MTDTAFTNMPLMRRAAFVFMLVAQTAYPDDDLATICAARGFNASINNVQLLNASGGLTGFIGLVGATDYSVPRVLDKIADVQAFAADNQKEAQSDEGINHSENRYQTPCRVGGSRDTSGCLRK